MLILQKLPIGALKKLKMRQGKVRTLPMLLHSKTLILPEYRGLGNIVISAPVPFHFNLLMSALSLNSGTSGKIKKTV